VAVFTQVLHILCVNTSVSVIVEN